MCDQVAFVFGPYDLNVLIFYRVQVELICRIWTMLGMSSRTLIASEVLTPSPELFEKIPSLTQISEISILFFVNVPVLSVA
jgi:hypothetical protein